MLCLSRKAGQTICIGDDIEITVIKIDETKVRLGINAPRGVPVHRSEIAAAIERERILEETRKKI
jgi:carbon storage regulator